MSGRSSRARLEPTRAVAGLEDGHALGLQVDAAEQADGRLVVDDQYRRHALTRISLPGSAMSQSTVAAAAAGSWKEKTAPAPSPDSTQMRPPIAPTSPSARKSPSPVSPEPTVFAAASPR